MRNLVFGEYKLGLESFNKEVSFLVSKVLSGLFWLVTISIFAIYVWSNRIRSDDRDNDADVGQVDFGLHVDLGKLAESEDDEGESI